MTRTRPPQAVKCTNGTQFDELADECLSPRVEKPCISINGSELTIGIDEAKNYGISNQLIGLQNSLCVARAVGVCAFYSAPLGYAAAATHGMNSTAERRVPTTQLLRFSPWAQAALARGDALPPDRAPTQQSAGARKSMCRGFVPASARKARKTRSMMAGLMSVPKCLARRVADGQSHIFVQNGFYISTKGSACNGHSLVDVVGVAPAVEEAARRLKERLGLADGRPYVAVQYRAGADRREKERVSGKYAGICYGRRTIDGVLRARGYEKYPRFMLTNVAGYDTEQAHDPSSPSVVRLLAESLVASEAEFLLLNKASTIRTLVLRLRQIQGRPLDAVYFVEPKDVVDACTCHTLDEGTKLQQSFARLCSRPDEFPRYGPAVTGRPWWTDFNATAEEAIVSAEAAAKVAPPLPRAVDDDARTIVIARWIQGRLRAAGAPAAVIDVLAAAVGIAVIVALCVGCARRRREARGDEEATLFVERADGTITPNVSSPESSFKETQSSMESAFSDGSDDSFPPLRGVRASSPLRGGLASSPLARSQWILGAPPRYNR